MKLIDKEKVVEYILKRKSEIYDEYGGIVTTQRGLVEYKVLQEMQSFLNTLEVKEVDLVEEIDYKDYIRFFEEHPEYNDGSWGFEETWAFAQYCYKLGLNARKGK